MRWQAVFVAFFCASGLHAAIGPIQPSNPTTNDVVVITVATFSGDLRLQPVVIEENEIRITFRGNPVVANVRTERVPVGPLPAGVYTIVLRHVIEDGFGGVLEVITDPPATFTVTQAAAIPALDPIAIAALIGCLATVAALSLRRL